MNARTFLLAAGAAAAAAGVPVAQAQQANVTVYGRLNTGIEHVRGVDGSRTRLSNYRSVIGFRGQEDLGDGLKAIFQIEGGFSVDTGSGALANRDTRVGLAGPWGTLFAGVWTLPYTAATSSFDPFYPTTAGYMAIMGNGSAPNTTHTGDTSSFDRRQANQLQYWSPRWKGLSARVAYSFAEETVEATGAKPWLASGALTYESGDWLATVAHERHAQYQTADGADTGTKVGVAYQWGPARLAAAFERLAYETASGSLTRRAWTVSGVYRVGSGSIKAGFTRAADGRGASTETVGFFRSGRDTGASQLTVGYEHELSRRTSVQTYYSRIRNDAGAIYDFAINELGVAAGQRPSVFALGVRHAF